MQKALLLSIWRGQSRGSAAAFTYRDSLSGPGFPLSCEPRQFLFRPESAVPDEGNRQIHSTASKNVKPSQGICLM